MSIIQALQSYVHHLTRHPAGEGVLITFSVSSSFNSFVSLKILFLEMCVKIIKVIKVILSCLYNTEDKEHLDFKILMK